MTIPEYKNDRLCKKMEIFFAIMSLCEIRNRRKNTYLYTQSEIKNGIRGVGFPIWLLDLFDKHASITSSSHVFTNPESMNPDFFPMKYVVCFVCKWIFV